MRIARLLCAASVLALPVAAYAQQITSGIEGTVADASGSRSPAPKSTVTDTRTGASATITTDSAGRFATAA